MGLKWTNFARAKLATPPSGTGGLSFTVEAGKGTLFPSLGAGDYFYAVLKNAAKTVSEVVKVEARSTDALTIATGGRGLDGTSAQTWTANDYVELCATRIAMLEVFNAAVVAIGAVTPAADKMVYFTSATAAAVLDFPSWARTFVSAANVTAAANALLNTAGNVGLGIATPSYKFVVSNGGASGFEFDPGSSPPLIQSYNRTSLAYEQMNFLASVLRVSTGASPAEALRVDTNRYLLVGYTASNGAYPLQVNGQIFATNATIATSDGRYKQNVSDIVGALDVVNALRPVSFRWKPHKVHNFDLDTEHIGFIAQEVGSVMDRTSYRGAVVKTGRAKLERGGRDIQGIVSQDGIDEEFLGLAEGKLIPLLVGAIKELTARVAALEGGK